MTSLAQYYGADLRGFLKDIVPAGNKSKIITSQELPKDKSDYLLLPNTLAYVDDVQSYAKQLRKNCHSQSRVVVIYYSFLWKPLLNLASHLGIRRKDIREPNWLSSEDIQSMFTLEGFDLVKQGRRFLFPIPLGPVSDFINRYIGQLPLINLFCLTTYQIYRVQPVKNDYTVSIIIPARNEAGNMKGVLKKIPLLGKGTEVIFVEGNSKDDTYQVIDQEIKTTANKKISASLYKQKGRGKGDAVRLGFQKAKNDILMILDADLTVDPNQLSKFYRALSEGYCDFANGSRLVYPMEQEAMRTLNYLGNKMFSLAFTFLMGQRVKDTLCGTKVLFKTDYQKIERNRSYFGDFDPFGDFDLLFGAAKLNMKIVDIPIRYKERVYGTTNISRFRHGLLLIKMVYFGGKKLKFI